MSTALKPNVELIDKVITDIKRRPIKNFNMNEWITPLDYEHPPVSEDGEILFCKTAVCLAGATLANSPVKADHKRLLLEILQWDRTPSSILKWSRTPAGGLSIKERAAKRLGISGPMASALFYTGNWPGNIKARINRGTLSERAAAVLLLKKIRDGKDPWGGVYLHPDYD